MRPLMLSALLLFSACDTQIQHGLDERAANELQTVLVERGIEADKVLEPGKKPTWGISVPDDRATDAVRILSELGLPRPTPQGFSEVFGKGSLVPTPTEERALYVQALSGELSRTLEGVDGVTAARVHIVVPPPVRPGLEPPPAKAAAYLRVRPGRAAELQSMREQLSALVAGSVEGLKPEAVTLVIDEINSNVAPPPAGRPPLLKMRVLLAVLGGAVAVLSVALVWLVLRLRRASAQSLTPAMPPRPMVATAARKVA